MSEATLHCPSPSRAFTAGAIALAVISPALDPVEHAAEAVPPVRPADSDGSDTIRIEERTKTTERASRAAPRRFSLARSAAQTARAQVNPFARPDGGAALRTAVELAVVDEREALRTAETLAAVEVREHLRGAPADVDSDGEVPADTGALLAEADRTARTLAARRVQQERAQLRALREAQRVAAIAAESPRAYDGVASSRSYDGVASEAPRTFGRYTYRSSRAYNRSSSRQLRSVVTRYAPAKQAGQRVMRMGNGMTAVIAFARSQVGKRYVSGGLGPNGFDCSGFTKRAYALAGIRLPHSSGAQAARSRSVSRSQARPGDLVVGPGHVGIYMGRGMMIDAGNHRTGVVYRKVYGGLRVARIS
ncbi:NlpC/P60 family protein [Actinoplanes sp. Pm04-4]|uniref:NlpC/P60 family protein n=1 Tax=Paractinoplanes pyxinae TaxID=2997416 RepID=A0ABT4B4I9_9ACTN|nr:C40 family peptidase [Actinoplanes pyxinae]MCY1141408.1 NlpC/P60 family protein [Actinoplanes pyxinae]